MKNCNICGERLSITDDAYQMHLNRFHPTKLDMQMKGLDKVFKRDIKPERTTNRTKKQIVFDMEKMWGVAVFPEVKPWHAFDPKGA